MKKALARFRDTSLLAAWLATLLLVGALAIGHPSALAGANLGSERSACLRRTVRWHCPDLGAEVPVRVHFKEARTAEPAPLIVYVMNHGYPRVGQESDDSILEDYLNQRYLVVTVDFAGLTNAVSPVFDHDLLALQQALYGYRTTSILAGAGLVPLPDYCWWVPAGCRLKRDVVYFDLEKHGSFGTKEKVLEIWNTTVHQRFNVPLLKDPEAMRTRSGALLDYKLYLDVIYPSQPRRKLPLFIYNATQSIRTRCTRNDVASGPHVFGFALRGYVATIIDHCWNPLARHWAFGYFDGVYTLDPWNGLKSATAAVRFFRAHTEEFGIDSARVCVMGYSKGAYGVTRLSDPKHESQPEDAVFAGFPAGSPEPQPWSGVSSQITAGYQAVGTGTRKTQYVTGRQVPTFTACGRFDKFKFWPIFPQQVQVYEARDVNHLALWMHELAHEPPHGRDPWLDRDRYALFVTFFDQYLKPDEHPAPRILYTFPVDKRTNVTCQGCSQALPDLSLLDTNASKHVSFMEPITVHFAPQMDVASIARGGIRVTRTSDGATVAGAWTAGRGNTLFKFRPAADLAPHTEYRLTITTQSRNASGVALAAEQKVHFETGPQSNQLRQYRGP